jgi:hypothetical protein
MQGREWLWNRNRRRAEQVLSDLARSGLSMMGRVDSLRRKENTV